MVIDITIMEGEKMEKEILEVISEVLHEPVTVETTWENTPVWDSLHHFQLIVALEEELGLEIKIEQVAKLKSVKAIIALAEENRKIN